MYVLNKYINIFDIKNDLYNFFLNIYDLFISLYFYIFIPF